MGELDTRAVTMVIPMHAAGNCAKCRGKIVFAPPGKDRWVLANIYHGRGAKRKWDRLEYFHSLCYTEANEPYGKAAYKKTRQGQRKGGE